MLSWLYDSVSKIRNYSFDKKIFKTIKVDRPVVSIGNITVGGTGKTPIVDHILQWAKKNQFKVGVVSRGYGGNFEGVKKVPTNADPKVYGDEPSMLATRNSEVPIYVCPDRVKAAQELINNEKVQFLLADDAFQHRRLARDIDIVIIDLLEPKEKYKLLPLGRARESLESLKRADFIILNKSNLVSPQQMEEITSYLKPYTSENCVFLRGEYCAGQLVKIHNEAHLKNEISQESWLLVSGIGRPQSFASLVQNQGLKFIQHKIYKDHYVYTINDIEEIEELAKNLGLTNVLCTQKDAVKLKQLISKNSKFNWYYLDMSIELHGAEKLYDKIIQLCKHQSKGHN